MGRVLVTRVSDIQTETITEETATPTSGLLLGSSVMGSTGSDSGSVSDGFVFGDGTVGSGGELPRFSDSFETGDRSFTDGGVSWTSSNNVTVSAENPRTGTYSLRFKYAGVADGEDGFSEQRFSLGADYTSLWISYYIYVPSNYYHRNSAGVDNNKWFRVWASDTDFHLTTEMEEQDDHDGTSYIRRFLCGSRGINGAPTSEPGRADIIGAAYPIKPGQWNYMQFWFQSASDRETQDGTAEWWANGTKIQWLNWDLWANDGGDGGDPGQPAYVNNGYILGWSNAGFDNDTIFHVDDIDIYTSNPGWW